MKQKIYENKKISGIIFVVLLWFVLAPLLPLNIRVIKEVSGVLVGMNSVTLLFCVLLKQFDSKSEVGSFFLFLEIFILSELTLFLVTDGYAAFGIWGILIVSAFENFKLICMFKFYEKSFGKSVFPLWVIVIICVANNAFCVFLPQYAYIFSVTMAIPAVVSAFGIYHLRKTNSTLFLWGHLIQYGGIVCTGLWTAKNCSEAVVFFGFLGSAIGGVIWGVSHMKEIVKNRNDEVKSAEKDINLKNEEMRVMLSQIKPHFIYNTLNTIQYLCRTDGELAADTISDFSDYLRTNLNFDSNRQVVPFREELEHVNKYLKIEKLRFRHRLMVKYDIKEDDFVVPTLSLQPIIENAVKHGISKRLNGGTITISTNMDEENYVIEIKDNGVGFTEKERASKEKNTKRKSLGLKNIENRIETLLDGRLEIVSRKERGTKATILLPIAKNLEEGEKHENSIY